MVKPKRVYLDAGFHRHDGKAEFSFRDYLPARFKKMFDAFSKSFRVDFPYTSCFEIQAWPNKSNQRLTNQGSIKSNTSICILPNPKEKYMISAN